MRTDGSATASLGGGALDMDPACNPAVLDTATWDPASVIASVEQSGAGALARVDEAIRRRQSLPELPRLTLYEGSAAVRDSASFVLAGLADDQYVILEFRGSGERAYFGEPVHEIPLGSGTTVAIHATSAAHLHAYVRTVALGRGPRALGDTPRLGVGVRMTTACWPAVFRAMDSGGFSTNAIQNSVRELNFLADLVAGRPADRNYYSGFGMIETGHTGSTFEGLWVRGVLEGLKRPPRLPFGADADHLQVKRGADGLARARRFVDSYRYYTFFTMDMADILDYASIGEPSDAVAADRATSVIGCDGLLREVVAYHRRPPRTGGAGEPHLPEPVIHRLVGKYWTALEALAEVDAYLRSVREGEPYDLEFTIDEHPPEIPAFDCLTSDEECLFVLGEIDRRQLPVTHLAPNVGIEKGFDYRGTDGPEGLERRLASLVRIASARGIVLDIHSADDLTAATRAAIRRATGGLLHYKVSPMPQILFAEVLEQVHPEFFTEWWNDAVAYASDEAATGSPFAAGCLAELEGRAGGRPSHRDQVFHHYSFRFVGRRDARGRFLNRQRFYSLSSEFYRTYEDRLAGYLEGLAEELFV